MTASHFYNASGAWFDVNDRFCWPDQLRHPNSCTKFRDDEL